MFSLTVLMLLEESQISLSIVWQMSGTYSQSLLQALKLGPFVLTNVTNVSFSWLRKAA